MSKPKELLVTIILVAIFISIAGTLGLSCNKLYGSHWPETGPKIAFTTRLHNPCSTTVTEVYPTLNIQASLYLKAVQYWILFKYCLLLCTIIRPLNLEDLYAL